MLKILLVVLLGGISVFAQSGAQLNRDPKTVKFVTSDVDNFWAAYDIAAKETDRSKRVAIFQSQYLDRGSAGLKDFIRLRIKSADALVTSIDGLPKYYASIRPSTLELKRMEKRMRKSFAKFKSIYPDAVFPDVYFLVGIANTGGTTGPSGLLIGAEMYGKTKHTPTEELPDWLRFVLAGVEQVPGIVAHESCHYNQNLPRQTTLLAKALQEGGCDFIGELISGQNINDKLKIYGGLHAAQLRRDFTDAMDKPDISNWFYNAATASKDRPADLGYHVGYIIALNYYHRAKDKRQAVRDILNISDFRKFYADSGYNTFEKS